MLTILHRDLKPSNILVRTDGQAKLLDFGIAKLLECDGQSGEPSLTLEGGRAMTPEYAAPEQLTGEAVTAATDVYTSGVLLYVPLTGHHPAGAGPRTPASLVKAILETDPPHPSEVVAAAQANNEVMVANASKRATTSDKLSRLLRGDLDTIVAKALKKNPQERYSSIKDFADDLQRYLRHEPIGARPDTIGYRTGRFARRHRASVVATLLAALALIGTTAFTWLYPRRAVPLPKFNQRKLTANSSESFDPASGPGRELIRIPLEAGSSADIGFDYGWQLSPDGSRIAILKRHGNQIRLVPLEGGRTKTITVKNHPDRVDLNWATDSRSMFVSTLEPGGAALLHIELNGEAQPIWRQSQAFSTWGFPSPDGRHLAILGSNAESNAWLIDNF
jgi:serine/threonine protein kinase